MKRFRRHLWEEAEDPRHHQWGATQRRPGGKEDLEDLGAYMRVGWRERDPPVCGSASERRWRAKSPTLSPTSSSSMRPHARCWWGTGGWEWCAVWSSWGSWLTSLGKTFLCLFCCSVGQQGDLFVEENMHGLHVPACLRGHRLIRARPCKYQQLLTCSCCSALGKNIRGNKAKQRHLIWKVPRFIRIRTIIFLLLNSKLLWNLADWRDGRMCKTIIFIICPSQVETKNQRACQFTYTDSLTLSYRPLTTFTHFLLWHVGSHSLESHSQRRRHHIAQNLGLSFFSSRSVIGCLCMRMCVCVFCLFFVSLHLWAAEPEELCVMNTLRHMLTWITINRCPIHCQTAYRRVTFCWWCWWWPKM